MVYIKMTVFASHDTMDPIGDGKSFSSSSSGWMVVGFPNVHAFMISWSMIRFIVETVVLWNHFIYFLVPLLLLRPDVDRLLTFRWILWVDTGAAACSAV